MNEELKNRLADFAKKYSIYFIILAIALIGWIAFAPQNKIKKDNDNTAQTSAYVAELETKLEKIVSSMSGNQPANVMLTIASQNKQVLAIDEKTSTNNSFDTSSGAQNKQTSVAVVNGSPIVVEQELPKISGVCVVYSGNGNKDDIKTAVATVLGIRESKVAIYQK